MLSPESRRGRDSRILPSECYVIRSETHEDYLGVFDDVGNYKRRLGGMI